MAKPRGRPKGPRKATDIVTVLPSRCEKCHSTRRTEYSNTIEHPYIDVDPGGRPYTAVVWRNTTCLDCGQARRDRTFRYEPAGDVKAMGTS